MDSKINLQELKEKIRKFCEERDWDQFHGAKDLTIGIVTEASELLEHFRFKSEDEIKAMLSSPEKKERLSEEMADIFYFLLRLAQKYDIDLSDSLNRKMVKNEQRYPVEQAKGSNKKYNEL